MYSTTQALTVIPLMLMLEGLYSVLNEYRSSVALCEIKIKLSSDFTNKSEISLLLIVAYKV